MTIKRKPCRWETAGLFFMGRYPWVTTASAQRMPSTAAETMPPA